MYQQHNQSLSQRQQRKNHHLIIMLCIIQTILSPSLTHRQQRKPSPKHHVVHNTDYSQFLSQQVIKDVKCNKEDYLSPLTKEKIIT